MRKTIIAAVAGVLIAGLAACSPQPGYGPGYGYGPSYGYGGGQPMGYYGQPAYSQPAANPIAQVLGAMLTPSGGGYGGGYGGGPGYYQPAPYYGSPYGYR